MAFFLHGGQRMRVLFVSLVFVVGCVADVAETEVENRAPVIELGALTIGEGQTKEIELVVSDPDGDAVEISYVGGLFPEKTESGEFEVYAPYGAAAPYELTVSARDVHGAITEEKSVIDVKPLGWRSAITWGAEGPEAREHGAMIVDAEGRYALLVGGSGYAPYLEPLGDVWRFDLDAKTWSSVTPTGDVPAPAGSRRVATVPGTKTAYLFAGYGEGNTVFDDLYRLDHDNGEAAFTLVSQMNPPPARALHAFFYDPGGDRFYAFGGFGSGIRDDLWSMQLVDGVAHWTEVVLPVRPSPRYGFFYGFDAEQGRLIVYSGAQGLASVDPAHDTWLLELRLEGAPLWWWLRGPGSPPGRRNGCMVFDPTGPRLWVFGGTPDAMTTAPGLWAFDARAGKEGWTELPLMGEPPLRSSGFGIFDAATEQVLLGFGNSSTGVYQDLNAIGY